MTFLSMRIRAAPAENSSQRSFTIALGETWRPGSAAGAAAVYRRSHLRMAGGRDATGPRPYFCLSREALFVRYGTCSVGGWNMSRTLTRKADMASSLPAPSTDTESLGAARRRGRLLVVDDEEGPRQSLK